jgi:hypothetical protein
MKDNGQTLASKRSCLAPGCTTMLSTYNTDHLCFAHDAKASRDRFESTTARYRQTIESRSYAGTGLVVISTS